MLLRRWVSPQNARLPNMGGPEMRKVHPNISRETRRAKNLCRGQMDLLRSRLNLLGGKDKLLLTMYLEKGSSFRQLARLTGVSDTIIARRIYNLIGRLTDGRYVACLRNRSRFTNQELALAKDRFLMGLSVRKIAQKYHSTDYYVHKTLKHIQQIMGTIRQDAARNAGLNTLQNGYI